MRTLRRDEMAPAPVVISAGVEQKTGIVAGSGAVSQFNSPFAMISVISGHISYRIQGNLPASLQVRIADHLSNESDWFEKLSFDDNIMGKTSVKRCDNDEPGLGQKPIPGITVTYTVE